MLSLSVMECPNCHFENKGPATECLKCGIVFAKYGHKQQAVEAPATVSEENLPSTSTREEERYVIWTGSILNIPFGETENGVTDPSVLTETYGWPIALLINRYVRLANTCLAGLTVTYIAGIAASMARGLSARKPA